MVPTMWIKTKFNHLFHRFGHLCFCSIYRFLTLTMHSAYNFPLRTLSKSIHALAGSVFHSILIHINPYIFAHIFHHPTKYMDAVACIDRLYVYVYVRISHRIVYTGYVHCTNTYKYHYTDAHKQLIFFFISRCLILLTSIKCFKNCMFTTFMNQLENFDAISFSIEFMDDKSYI